MAALMQKRLTIEDKIGELQEKLILYDVENSDLDKQIRTAQKEVESLEQLLIKKKTEHKEKLTDQYYNGLKDKVADKKARMEKQEKQTEKMLEELETFEENGGFDNESTAAPYLRKLSKDKDDEIAALEQELKECSRKLDSKAT